MGIGPIMTTASPPIIASGLASVISLGRSAILKIPDSLSLRSPNFLREYNAFNLQCPEQYQNTYKDPDRPNEKGKTRDPYQFRLWKNNIIVIMRRMESMMEYDAAAGLEPNTMGTGPTKMTPL